VLQLAVRTAKESFQIGIPYGGDAEWSVAVPARELMQVIEVAPDPWIEMATNNKELFLISGQARWTIVLLEGGYDIPEQTRTEGLAINKDSLVNALENVRYAASKTESRPSFMQLNIRDKAMTAADGRRVHVEFVDSGDIELSVPEKVADTLIEAINAANVDLLTHEVYCSSQDGSLRFTYAEMVYEVGELNYPFPDLEAIVMSKARAQTAGITAEADDLLTAVKVASASAGVGGQVDLIFTDGLLSVEGSSARSKGNMNVRVETDGVPSGTRLAIIADDLLEVLGKQIGQVRYTVGTGTETGWLYTDSGFEAAIRPVTA